MFLRCANVLEDVGPLAGFFLQQHDPRRRFSPEAIEVLQRHSWPGNVRELRNVVTRAAVYSSGDEIGAGDLPREIAGKQMPVFQSRTNRQLLARWPRAAHYLQSSGTDGRPSAESRRHSRYLAPHPHSEVEAVSRRAVPVRGVTRLVSLAAPVTKARASLGSSVALPVSCGLASTLGLAACNSLLSTPLDGTSDSRYSTPVAEMK